MRTTIHLASSQSCARSLDDRFARSSSTPRRGITRIRVQACALPLDLANQDYLVPYRTAFLLYFTVRDAVTWTASTMGTTICKVFCDDPIRQRLKAASVNSEASEFGVYYRAQTVSTATYSLATTIQYGANAEAVP